MITITGKSTLEEIINDAKLWDREYMISPMSEIDCSFIPDLELQNRIKEFVNGRTFTQLSLEEIPNILTAWNLPSMISGMQLLTEQADKGKVIYDFWEDAEQEELRSLTGLAAFPLEKKAKFVFICPGGGYENVCSIAEGFPLAKAVQELGYAAFVLHYRTAGNARHPNPLDDVAQSLRFILEHADEFNLDTNGYAVLGFSAGGHLAASFGTEHLGYKKYGLPKPEIMILGYPVITMREKTHEGSRRALLGEENQENENLIEQLSIERQITKSYPPVYVWQCEEDEAVSIENSRMLAESLERCKVPYEYKIFPGTAHGWGLGIHTLAEGWLEEAVRFWEKVSYCVNE